MNSSHQCLIELICCKYISSVISSSTDHLAWVVDWYAPNIQPLVCCGTFTCERFYFLRWRSKSLPRKFTMDDETEQRYHPKAAS